MRGSNRFAGSTFPAGRHQVGSRWEDFHWFEPQDIINFYYKCDVQGGPLGESKNGSSRREICRPRPGTELTEMEKKLIEMGIVIVESHPQRGNCEIRFLEPLPESNYVPKQKLIGGKLTQQVIRNLTVRVRKGALPEEAACQERVRDTAFWKAFAAGITAPSKKAERELFRAVMARLQTVL